MLATAVRPLIALVGDGRAMFRTIRHANVTGTDLIFGVGQAGFEPATNGL